MTNASRRGLATNHSCARLADRANEAGHRTLERRVEGQRGIALEIVDVSRRCGESDRLNRFDDLVHPRRSCRSHEGRQLARRIPAEPCRLGLLDCRTNQIDVRTGPGGPNSIRQRASIRRSGAHLPQDVERATRFRVRTCRRGDHLAESVSRCDERCLIRRRVRAFADHLVELVDVVHERRRVHLHRGEIGCALRVHPRRPCEPPSHVLGPANPEHRRGLRLSLGDWYRSALLGCDLRSILIASDLQDRAPLVRNVVGELGSVQASANRRGEILAGGQLRREFGTDRFDQSALGFDRTRRRRGARVATATDGPGLIGELGSWSATSTGRLSCEAFLRREVGDCRLLRRGRILLA